MTLPTLAQLNAHLDGGFDASLGRLKDFLRIPCVGTDPAYKADTLRCAEWLAGELRGIGFEAGARPTAGMPMVVGHWKGPEGAPHILYYGHYDVQPADPFELWDSPPFEPKVIDGRNGPRLVARGAVDDKGQVMTWVEAFRAWKALHGGPPVSVSVIVEGEEEAVELVARTSVWTLAESLGGVESLIEHPARMTHAATATGPFAAPRNLVRRSVGIESADDLVADLEQALAVTVRT